MYLFLYDVVNIDITNNFNSIFNIMLDLFSYIFNQLNSITIGGVSLLSIFITILIFSAVLPLLFTLASSGTIYSVNYAKSEKRKAERAKGKGKSN